MQITFWNN